jgi:hypothetical protein
MVHGYDHANVIDEDSVTLTNLEFMAGVILEAAEYVDESLVSIKPSLYGPRPNSEEYIEEVVEHLKTHPFRRMKSIISKSARLNNLGKEMF